MAIWRRPRDLCGPDGSIGSLLVLDHDSLFEGRAERDDAPLAQACHQPVEAAQLEIAAEDALKTGQTIGGIPFTRGPLAHLLRNRFYIGEVVFKDEVLPGQQPAILDRDLFDAVQTKLNDQRTNHTTARAKSDSLLIGRIYDDRGNRMSPSHARKRGIRYRYYVASPLLHGQAERAGSVRRVPAAEIEALVGRAVREHLKDPTQTEDRDLISTHVVRVEVQVDQLAVELNSPKQRQVRGQGNGSLPDDEPGEQDADRTVLHIPWRKIPSKRRREIIIPKSAAPQGTRPIRAETRAKLVASIARGPAMAR
jgi:site-specific DNA recombinase